MVRCSFSIGILGLSAGLLLGAPALAQDGASDAERLDGWERERALEPDSFTYQRFARAWDAVARAIEVHGGSSIDEAYTDIAMSFAGEGTRTASQRFVGETVDYEVRGAVGFSGLFDALSFIEGDPRRRSAVPRLHDHLA